MDRRLLRISVMVGACILVAPAAASDPPPRKPPPDNAAIAVYVEEIPTSGGSIRVGPRAPRSGSSRPEQAPARELAPSVRKQIERQAGNDAAVLEEIATSPALGAPPTARGPREDSEGAGGAVSAQSTIGLVKGLWADRTRDPKVAGLLTMLVLSALGIVLARGRERAAEARATGTKAGEIRVLERR